MGYYDISYVDGEIKKPKVKKPTKGPILKNLYSSQRMENILNLMSESFYVKRSFDPTQRNEIIACLDVTESNSHVSYITMQKAFEVYSDLKIEDKFENWVSVESKNPESPLYKKHRTEVKVGRLFRKMFYTNSDLEGIVNVYKSTYDSFFTNRKEMIDIISGEDIRKFYHENNYIAKGVGQMGKSCMSKDVCQDYLDIYVNNPDVISLVVLYSNDKKKHIMGRALLWELSNGKKYLDRIYTTLDSDRYLISSWGTDRGYILFDNVFYNNKSKDYDKRLIVNIKNTKFGFYPFMDTFKFLNSTFGKLGNKRPWFLLFPLKCKKLSSVNGSWD